MGYNPGYQIPKFLLLLTSLICMTSQGRCDFWDESLSWDERVNDLVSRLSVSEIVQQLANGGRTTHAPAIPRLGIKAYPWGSECLHGDATAGPATSFPQAIGLAATFSRDVIFNISRAIGLEVRSKFNLYSKQHNYGQHTSASCWSPVINIMRDPRWGRNQETYGEDPYLSGELAESFVHGLQGNHPRYIMANAGCKHYAAYAGPENIPQTRHTFDAKVSSHDLRTTFLPAFYACVRAGSLSLMCSYNSVNGVPACANKELLTDILRKEWGFNGYVISDEGAIEDILNNHHYTKTAVEAAAAAVNAGCNLEDGPGWSPFYFKLDEAYKQNLISAETLREAAKPLFYTRMRIGEFDEWKNNPFYQLNQSDYIQSPEHQQLALLTALRSFVLLKNDGVLPLKTNINKLAVVGPFANNIPNIFSEYAPDPEPRYVTTVYQGLKQVAKSTTTASGCVDDDPHCTQYHAQELRNAVREADVIVLALGTGAPVESEGNDRSDLRLPGYQGQILNDSIATGKPIILLLFNAGPLDVKAAQNKTQVRAIVACFFPGQATGEALRRMFLNEGETANPSGRLPFSWFSSLKNFPPITNYSMAGRTYKYLNYDVNSPLYPFGYGLSYSMFYYRTLHALPQTLRYPAELTVTTYIENKGPHDGEEVAQVYISWLQSSQQEVLTPRWKLAQVSRVFIPAGSGVELRMRIEWDQLALWVNERWIVPTGVLGVYVGGQQPHQWRSIPGSNVLKTKVNVV